MKRLIKFFATLFHKVRYFRVCKIHVMSVVLGNCRFGGNNKIGAHSKFYNSEIGFASYIGDYNVFIDTKIGRFCSIGSNIRLISSSHPTKNVISTHPAFYSNAYNSLSFVDKPLYNESLRTEQGNCLEIGNDVWIGDNVLIKGGVEIGNGAVIAMGSVVTKSVPPYAIVGGIPARVIRYRFSQEEIKQLENFAWWNQPLSWIKDNANKFMDADTFLRDIEVK